MLTHASTKNRQMIIFDYMEENESKGQHDSWKNDILFLIKQWDRFRHHK